MFKKWVSKLCVLLSALLAFSLVAPTAYADDINNGGHHKPSTGGQRQYWMYADHTPGAPLPLGNQLQRSGGIHWAPGSSQEKCQQSSWLLYVHTPPWVTVDIVYGRGPTNWNEVINLLRIYKGNDVANAVIAKFGAGARADSNTEGMNIVCGIDFEQQIIGGNGWFETTGFDSADWQGLPTSHEVDIARNITEHLKDPIRENNLHNQAGKPTATPYVDFIQGHYDSVGEMREAYNRAHAEYEKLIVPVPRLDKANKEGLGEGGILDYTERSQFGAAHAWEMNWYRRRIKYELKGPGRPSTPEEAAKISAWREQIDTCLPFNPATATRHSSYCGDYKVSLPPGWDWDLKEIGPAERYGHIFVKTESIDPTPKVTKFWQVLAVHCNRDGFDQVKNWLAGQGRLNTVNVDSKGGSFYGTLSTSPTPTWSPLIGRGTGRAESLDFYTKECAVACTADTKDLTGELAPYSVNGSQNVPVQGGANGKGGAYGKGDKTSNSNELQIFRDNARIPLNVDLWYPVTSPDYLWDGRTPRTTTIQRWSGGTPGIDGKTGGKFMLALTERGNSIFDNAKSALPRQFTQDWQANGAMNQITLKGLANKFYVGATWASDPDKPNILRFIYEYDVKAKSVIPEVIGEKPNDSNGLEISPLTVYTSVDGKCYASFGAPDNRDRYAEQLNKSTGVDTDDTLAQQFINGDKDSDNNRNLYVKVYRAVGD